MAFGTGTNGLLFIGGCLCLKHTGWFHFQKKPTADSRSQCRFCDVSSRKDRRGTGQIRGESERRMELGSRMQEVLYRRQARGGVAKQIGEDPESRNFSAKQSV